MTTRIEQEIGLLRNQYPHLKFEPTGNWIHIPNYPLPSGWNKEVTDVVFQIPPAYPGTPPYGIYVPSGIRFNESMPNSYKEPVGNKPPFDGDWGMFSWSPDGNQWKPAGQIISGSNLLNWVQGFAIRFREGV